MPSGQESTHLSQTMHSLSETFSFLITFSRTSISIGHTLVHALHEVQLAALIGVILNNEYFEEIPEIVIKGQSKRQYDLLPV
jgi:hypothetical protein